MEKIVALGAPAVIGGVLFGLPFVDRGESRSPRARAKFLAVLVVGVLGAAALIVVSTQADAGDAALQKRLHAAEAQAAHARQLARQGVPVSGGLTVYENEPHFAAKKIWAERCAGCHEGDERKSPVIAAGYGSRAWIRDFFADPDGDRFFGRVEKIQGAKGRMKPVEEKGADRDALVEWVYAQSGASDADAALVARGKAIFDEGKCSDCHYDDGTSEDGAAPNLGGRGTRAWFVGFLSDPGHARYFGELNDMPAFGSKLSPVELERVAAWLEWLRDQPVP